MKQRSKEGTLSQRQQWNTQPQQQQWFEVVRGQQTNTNKETKSKNPKSFADTELHQLEQKGGDVGVAQGRETW